MSPMKREGRRLFIWNKILKPYKELEKGKTMQKVAEELLLSQLLLVFGTGREVKLKSGESTRASDESLNERNLLKYMNMKRLVYR
jgi:hypothetical protein